MSDLGRKDIGDKVKSTVKPDSEKSNFENLKDTVTDKVDNAASKGTPNDQKSYVQQASDAVFGSKD